MTVEGLKKILAFKASINQGLSEQLKTAFPNVLSVARPMVTNQKIPDGN
jgi:hypothetical protein